MLGVVNRSILRRYRRAFSSTSSSTEDFVVMISGLPGRMGIGLAEAVVDRFGQDTLLPYALTGEGMGDSVRIKDSVDVKLIPPSRREEMWEDVREFAKEAEKTVVAIDFTHPDAALPNVEFYSEERIPFVMGTTGGDMETMERMWKSHI